MARHPSSKEWELKPKKLEKGAIKYGQTEETFPSGDHYFYPVLQNISEKILVFDSDYRVADANDSFLFCFESTMQNEKNEKHTHAHTTTERERGASQQGTHAVLTR